MGKSLIITEKPSVAREFASCLHVSGNHKGYIENEDYVITWCVGHLVEMVYPEDYDIKYKKWRLEDLPFLPETYKYGVKQSVAEQYNIVHGMLQRQDIDRVYWAGDAGKEGQTIEENIRNFGGVREGMEELRVWIDSQTEEEILRGIRQAKPMSEYANLGNSGIMRTIEDYAMGINFSRVMSVKYANMVNRMAGSSGYSPIAVGRVMTCVLGMVVEREREIRNFKETPFYRIVGSFTDAGVEAEWRAVEGSAFYQSPKLYKENGFKEEKDAQALIDSLQGKPAAIASIEKSTSRKKAPLLFNLAELQAECTKRFKISPDQTLQCAQELYEKKLTTYPRTDARVLSTAIAGEIGKNISRLKAYEPTAAFADHILAEGLHKNIAKTVYTDDSKVTDHYAIIPTGQLTELRSLNSLQRSVYDLIVRRFLSIFYPPAEYENVKMTVAVEKEKFFASAKVLKSPGYLEVAGIPKKNQTDKNDKNDSEEGAVGDPKVLLELASRLKKGDPVAANGYQIRYGKTSPPKRYTSGSMVLAMENAGQLIEDEELREQIKGSGIGTSATRAEIIAKLVRIAYLNLNAKTQILTPENKGEMIYEVVRLTVPAMLNPKMTASWEKGLDGITRGTVDFWDYRRKLEDYIRRETVKMIGQDIKEPLTIAISAFADAKAEGVKKSLGVACPLCGEGTIMTTPFGYGCSRYAKDKSGCNFVIGQICEKVIDENDAKDLLEKGRTKTISGFKSKAGKKFAAALKLEKDEKGIPKISFDFTEADAEAIEGISCPICGGKILKTGYGFRCEKYVREDANSCRFTVGQIAGKTLSQKDLTVLLTEGRTETIRGFKSKAGKKFDACLMLKKDENGKVSIAFDFEHVEDEMLPPEVKCPVCGGAIKKTSFGFGCINYNGEEEGSCRFSIGQIAGKKLTAANVKQLLTEGRTDTIRGFKSKAGKKFDACLVLKKSEDGKVSASFDFGNVEPKKLSDVKCPLCGGAVVITPFGYACENNKKDDPESCKFMVGSIASVKLKPAQMTQLLKEKKTDVIEGFVAKTGMKFSAPLKLKEDGTVAFDFPEKEQPKESSLKCPKCGKLLKKSRWQYECECGFKISHTVAKVELTEAVLEELFTTGQTKEKVSGFTSKAGNTFDAALKYADDRIQFDFDRPDNTKAPVDKETRKRNENAGKIDFGNISDTESAGILAQIEALKADGKLEEATPESNEAELPPQNDTAQEQNTDDMFAMYAAMAEEDGGNDISDDMLSAYHNLF